MKAETFVNSVEVTKLHQKYSVKCESRVHFVFKTVSMRDLGRTVRQCPYLDHIFEGTCCGGGGGSSSNGLT